MTSLESEERRLKPCMLRVAAVVMILEFSLACTNVKNEEKAFRATGDISLANSSANGPAGEVGQLTSEELAQVDDFRKRIRDKISKNLVNLGVPTSGNAELKIKLFPSGEIMSVEIQRSSGYQHADLAALRAVQKSQPLPVPPNKLFRLFSEFYLRIGFR